MLRRASWERASSLTFTLRSLATCAAQPPLLAHETAAAGDTGAGPTTHVLLAHGLLGSGRNWRSFARALAKGASQAAGGAPVAVTAIDLRCHGGSGPASASSPRPLPHTVEAAAADVLATASGLYGGHPPHVLVGHSLGGKVVLEAARQALVSAHPLPSSLWVLDSPLSARRRPPPPSPRPPTTAGILAALRGVRVPVASRAAAAAELSDAGVPPAVATWLTSSLVPVDATTTASAPSSVGYVWSFDLAGAASLFESYASTSAWPLLHHPPPGLALHVVVGGASDRWSRAELDRLEAAVEGAPAAAASAAASAGGSPPGSLTVHTLPGAGHWVHVDAPGGLLDLLTPDVAAISRRVVVGK